MIERKDRLQTAFEFLRNQGKVHTQKDVARIMQTTEPNISAALKGSERVFRQKKTKEQEYLDITEQAARLMGKRGDDDEYVFTDIHTPSTTNNAIKLWVARAGIKKDITFHCARHTFATMMLDLGNDLYTVSKLLGHREIATTQIYAKVLDKNKQKAISSIPDVLG